MTAHRSNQKPNPSQIWLLQPSYFSFYLSWSFSLQSKQLQRQKKRSRFVFATKLNYAWKPIVTSDVTPTEISLRDRGARSPHTSACCQLPQEHSHFILSQQTARSLVSAQVAPVLFFCSFLILAPSSGDFKNVTQKLPHCSGDSDKNKQKTKDKSPHSLKMT